MSYTLNFPVTAGSPEPINRIAAAVRSVGESTKAINPGMTDLDVRIKALTASGLTLSQALQQVAAAGPKVQAVVAPVATGFTNTANAARNLGTTLQTHTVPQMAAASAALRTLEGHLSIRAAERFITTFRGMGPVLQAAFPVFGAIAFLGFVEQMVSKIGELYNAWNPVIRAQERSLELLKQSIPQLEKATKENEKLRKEERLLQHGPLYALKEEAQSSQGDIVSEERRIAYIKQQIATQQAIVTAGTIAPRGPTESTVRFGKGGAMVGVPAMPATPGYFTLEAQAAQQRLTDLKDSLETALINQDNAIRTANIAKAKLTKEQLAIQERESFIYKEGNNPIIPRGPSLFGPGRRTFENLPTFETSEEEIAKANYGASQAEADRLHAYGQGLLGRQSVDRGRIEAQVGGIRRGGTQQARLAGALVTNPTQEVAALRQALTIELQAAAAELEIKKTRSDIFDIAKEQAKFDEEVATARFQYEEKILELRKQQIMGERSFAGGLFDAAAGGGRGLSSFFRGQALGVGRTVFQNIATPIIGNIASQLHLSGVAGKLFQGTAFGADPLKSATDANTMATIANTQALAAVAGVSIGTGAASGIGGLSGLGTIFGGATNNPFIFNNNSGDGGAFPSPRNTRVDYGNGDEPGAIVVSDSSRSSTANVAKIGAAVGAGFAAYAGFRAGGAQGALQGTSAVLGAAALIPGPQQPFVMAAAIGTGLVASLIGDPKQARGAEITRALKYSQFVDPVAIHASMGTSGGYSDYDRFGNVRGSDLSPYGPVQQPYFDYRHETTVPGTGGYGPGGVNVTYNVQAMDSVDVKRFFDRHGDVVAATVAKDFSGQGIVKEAMRKTNS
jgi:hypothetical protein